MQKTPTATLVHPKGYKFGARPRSAPAKPYLQVGNYRTGAAPAPQPSIIRDFTGMSIGTHLNDRIGDCVIAAHANRIQVVSFLAGTPVVIPDSACLTAYEAVGGYNPNNPATDQGCDPTAAEQYMMTTGLAGHKLDAMGQIAFNNDFNLLKDALDWFEAVNLTVSFPAGYPLTAPVWDAPPAGWTAVESHEVEVVGYDANYVYALTWGYLQKLTWAFVKTCGTLALVGISKDMLSASGKAFNGLDVAALTADLDGQYGVVPVPAGPSLWARFTALPMVDKVLAAFGAAGLLAVAYTLLTHLSAQIN